jgi:NAD(P)-dependent dehydrogenase (short-subunit alcohol dehydrogenase family)
MHINLTGRKAIVTGSTAGIGRATAEGLARAGAAVVLNGRGSVRVDEAVRQIRDAIPGSDPREPVRSPGLCGRHAGLGSSPGPKHVRAGDRLIFVVSALL